jgi:hypothetical protein
MKKSTCSGVIMIVLSGIFVLMMYSPGCSQHTKLIRPMKAIKIDSITVDQEQITFKVAVETPDVCWEFSSYKTERKDNGIYVQIIGQRDRDAICAQMIGTFVATVTLNREKEWLATPSSEKQTFHFWQGESAALDTTIALK